jgi:hypothetical protein
MIEASNENLSPAVSSTMKSIAKAIKNIHNKLNEIIIH